MKKKGDHVMTLPAGRYGCHRCKAQPNMPHHPTCSDRSAYSDQKAYDRGWEDARVRGLETCREDSSAYKAGFRNGVVAREEADNVSWEDYYGR